MKKFIFSLFLIFATIAFADIKIGDLPLKSAATTGTLDSLPFVDAFTNVTRRVKLSDLINLPSMGSTYAKLVGSPTFTGSVTAGGGFVGNLTGNVTGNVSGSSTSFTGALLGDVTGVQSATVITNLARSKIAAGSTYRVVVNGSTGYLEENPALTPEQLVVTGTTGLLDTVSVTPTEAGYLAGVTSSIQDQLDSKQPSGDYITDLTGDVAASGPGSAVATITDLARSKIAPGSTYRVVINGSTGYLEDASAITAGRALISDSNGIPTHSVTTDTELSYVNGVTSSIQTQLNGKQATGNYITDLTGDATASGPGSAALTLATVNSNVGSFGSSTSIPSFTVNGKGLITAASGNAVVAPAGTLTGTTLAANVVSSSLTSVGTISSGTWNGSTVTVPYGGTGLTSGTSGGILGFTGSTTLASSGVLGASELLLGGGAGATPTSLGTKGTTTTVLHGNASGAPTFAAVSLTADVSGTLPTGNGGRGIEVQETPSGTVNSSNVTFTIANTPVSTASLKVYLDGLLQRQTSDYSLSGTTITFVTAPATGQSVYATYSR